MVEVGRLGSLSRREVVRGAISAGVALSAGGVLAGCGVSEAGSPPEAFVPPEKRKRGGTLRVGVAGGGLGNLDPHAPSAVGLDAILPNLFDKLVNLEPTTFKPVPEALESIEANSAGDRWTLKLRAGLTFHDGRRATSDDLLFTITHMMGKTTATAGALTLLNIKAVRKTDARTVRLDLEDPSGLVEEVLAASQSYLIPKTFDPNSGIGTGPFRLDQRKAGQETSFVRFEDYWGTEGPYVDRLVVTEFSDPTSRVNAFLAGQLDAIDAVPSAQRRVVQANPDMQMLVTKNAGWRGVVMNVNSRLFSSPKARQGLRLVVDRTQLLQAAYDDQGTVANDLYGPGDPFFDRSLSARPHDPEKGVALLRQAGVADQPMVLRTNSGAAGLKELGQVVAQQAKAAGLPMKVQVMDANAFYAGDYLNYPLGSSYWTNNPYLFQVTQIEWGKNAPYNQAGFDDPDFNALVTRATRELDDDKRRAITADMQEIQYDRGALLIPAYVDQLDAATRRVAGFVPDKRGLSLTSYQFKYYSLT